MPQNFFRPSRRSAPEIPYEPPVWFGNRSNGEYFDDQQPNDRRMRAEILKRGDEISRKIGMDRRQFMASSMGAALTMSVLNACGGEVAGATGGAASDAGDGGGRNSGRSGDGVDNPFNIPRGGPYVVPPEATCAESDFLGQDYFIMDVETHQFGDGEWRLKQDLYPALLRALARCSDVTDPIDCFDRHHYVRQMFLESDTTMSVLTSWPAATCFPERQLLKAEAQACGLPLANDAMRDLRDWVNALGKSQRVINQVQVMPNDNLERQLEGMYAAMEDPTWRAGSWKCHPAWRSDTYRDANGWANGFYLTDPIGVAFIEAGLKLGVPNFAVHKGLGFPGFDVKRNMPVDVGPVARQFPQANFVICHSAISAGIDPTYEMPRSLRTSEGFPYESTGEVYGVNLLIRSLIEAGLITENPDGTVTRDPGLNVYAEMSDAWSRVMRNPDLAQHYVGKLLKYLGPDNVLWGTGCILGGSPQGQIMLFKAFSITAEYQDRFGYPALTDAIRAKIFGLNAARLYGVDPEARRCAIRDGDLATAKLELDERFGPGRRVELGPSGPRTRAEFWARARHRRSRGLPG